MSMRVEEKVALEKIGMKSKKSKKKKMDELEEITDSTAVEEDAELEQSRVKNKKRKNKGNHMVAGDVSVNGESYGKLDTDNQPEKVKKKKKKRDKRLSLSTEEVIDCLNAATPEEASSLSLKKKDKKLKKKHKHEAHKDFLLNGTPDEDRTLENSKKQKTKRRKLKTGENKDALIEKTETEAKEKSNGVGNVEQQLMKNESNVYSTKSLHGKKTGNDEASNEGRSCLKEDNSKTENMGEKERRKKNRKRMAEEDNNDRGKKDSRGGEDVENSLVDCGMAAVEEVKNKKRKKEKITNKAGDINKAQDTETKNVIKRKKEKTKSVENDPKNPKPKDKQKKVRFSKNIEVFPSSDIINSGNEESEKEGLVQGKRFSPEEDEILWAAVRKYIESHGLGDKGEEMVMHCKSHPEVRHCWKEIGLALPHRPVTAVYYRAHMLFEGGERLEWTEEERELLRKEQEKHGNNWKLLAKELKRHRFHVKDTWRRIKCKRNSGHWSQEEYQTLFDYVNVDLRAKADEEKKSKYGMLRDNICWGAISDRLSTRSDATCCTKWYRQLTSPMVAEGVWADSDDYRLLDALFNLDACCIEDVDWDNLIEERSGDVCRQRWDQMVLHIGVHGIKSFAEQVEVLSKRYCPELLEAREAWESKPLVP